jgi:hypothetical protein
MKLKYVNKRENMTYLLRKSPSKWKCKMIATQPYQLRDGENPKFSLNVNPSIT